MGLNSGLTFAPLKSGCIDRGWSLKGENVFGGEDTHWCRKEYFYSFRNNIKGKRFSQEAVSMTHVLHVGEFRHHFCDKFEALLQRGTCITFRKAPEGSSEMAFI